MDMAHFGKRSRGDADTSDLSRLEGQVSAAENQLEELFSAVGRLYYEGHRYDPVPELGPYFQDIDALYGSIGEAQDAIRRLKGLVQCPQCGADMAQDAQFCTVCGSRILRPSQEAGGPCPHCGMPLVEGALFCMGCGARLEAEPVPEEVPAAAVCPVCGAPVKEGALFCVNCGAKLQAQPVPEPEEPARRVCPNCGTPVKEGTLFCTNCGVRLDAPAPEPAWEQEPAPAAEWEQDPAPAAEWEQEPAPSEEWEDDSATVADWPERPAPAPEEPDTDEDKEDTP